VRGKNRNEKKDQMASSIERLDGYRCNDVEVCHVCARDEVDGDGGVVVGVVVRQEGRQEGSAGGSSECLAAALADGAAVCVRSTIAIRENGRK
jgi:hypothetical protein